MCKMNWVKDGFIQENGLFCPVFKISFMHHFRMTCPLGILDNGTFVFLIKMGMFRKIVPVCIPDSILGNYDPSIPYTRCSQLNNRQNEHLLMTKGIQVGGIVAIFDYTGTTLEQLKIMFSPKESRDQSKYYQVWEFWESFCQIGCFLWLVQLLSYAKHEKKSSYMFCFYVLISVLWKKISAHRYWVIKCSKELNCLKIL